MKNWQKMVKLSATPTRSRPALTRNDKDVIGIAKRETTKNTGKDEQKTIDTTGRRLSSTNRATTTVTTTLNTEEHR